jgi:hypothetical protein
MPDFCDEFHSGGSQGILLWKIKMGFEKATLTETKKIEINMLTNHN